MGYKCWAPLHWHMRCSMLKPSRCSSARPLNCVGGKCRFTFLTERVLQILDSKNFSLERALEVDQRFLESASSSDEEGCLSEGPSTSAGAAATQPENPDTGTPTQPQHDATAGPSNGPASARPEKRSASDMEQPARVRASFLCIA